MDSQTHNVNVYDIEQEYDNWFSKQNIPVQFFVSMDGGGVNFYTIEFQEMTHAVAFIRQFDFRGDPYSWGEKKENEGWQTYTPDWRRK